MSLGEVDADLDMVSTLAADVMAKAILNAVKHAKGAYGLPSYEDLC
jgi:L-aminopeptidase/D-esterase-like protein